MYLLALRVMCSSLMGGSYRMKMKKKYDLNYDPEVNKFTLHSLHCTGQPEI